MSWMRRQQAEKQRQNRQADHPVSTVISPNDDSTSEGNVTYATWLAQCENDWKSIKAAQRSKAEKAELKRKAVARYRDFLTDWMDAENHHQNDVLVMNLIWAGDIADWEWLLTLTDYALDTDQQCRFFNRDPLHIAADAIFQGAEQTFKQTASVPEVFNTAFDHLENGRWSLNTSLQARFYKLAGELAEQLNEPDNALAYYRQADELKGDIGVKTRINRLQKPVEA